MFSSDIELAVKRSKKLERRLRQEFNASGTGLRELADSLEGVLPNETLQQLHDVTDMRNQIVHEDGQDTLESRHQFVQLCHNIEGSLDRLQRPWGCLVLVFLIAVAIIFSLFQNPL